VNDFSHHITQSKKFRQSEAPPRVNRR